MSRRPATSDDTELARRIHHAAYHDVVERQFGPWDEAQQDAFFARAWECAAHEIVLVDNVAVGYCAIEDHPEAIHVRELVIHPRHQSRGIGTALLRDLQASAADQGKAIRLGTFHQNRAQELYARLGFIRVGTTEVHVLMEWWPPDRRSDSPPHKSGVRPRRRRTGD
jgi:ribosomal protein S18 acetylase RimI-like enzyme